MVYSRILSWWPVVVGEFNGDFATVEKKEVHFGHNIPADYIDRIPELLIG